MSEIMLVNPRKRRKSRSPAQRAATRRMIAARTGRAPNPRKRRRAGPSTVSHVVGRVRRRHKALSVRQAKRRLHNPAGGIGAFLKSTLMPSAVGAAGALGLDVLLGYLPLPAVVQGPAIRPIIRIAGAALLGALIGKVAGRRNGELFAAGAITVTLYDTFKNAAKTMIPALPLSGTDQIGYYTAGPFVGDEPMTGNVYPGVGMYVE